MLRIPVLSTSSTIVGRSSNLAAGMTDIFALVSAARFKSMKIRVANRMTTERFHATRFILPTRLDAAAPTIAEEWDFDKNPMHVYPKIVGVASLTPVWWVCKECNESFQASPEKRVLRGFGCPHCLDRSRKESHENEKHHQKRARKGQALERLPGENDTTLKPKRFQLSQRTQY